MHGRHEMKRLLRPEDVMADLADKGITIRAGSLDNLAEEAPSSYKDVTAVVDICTSASTTSPLIVLTRSRPQCGHKQESL